MKKEIVNTILLAGMFTFLFVIAEVLYYKCKVKAGVTRQIVHIGTGLLCILFPFMLHDHWFVLLLCGSFAICLFLSLQFNFLHSINAIDRISYGSLLYPLAVYGCYLAYNYFHSPLSFYLPVLTLGICDPIAAIFGKQWPYGKFHISHDTKTVTGSVAFFLSSLVLALILLHIFSPVHVPTDSLLPISLLIAASATVTEACSIKGLDNITIPLCVLLIVTLVHG
jgi:phytol kinase